MRIDLYTKTILTIIAVFLGLIAARPLFNPTPVAAQATTQYSPNTHMILDGGGGLIFFDPATGDYWEYNRAGYPAAHYQIKTFGKQAQVFDVKTGKLLR